MGKSRLRMDRGCPGLGFLPLNFLLAPEGCVIWSLANLFTLLAVLEGWGALGNPSLLSSLW